MPYITTDTPRIDQLLEQKPTFDQLVERARECERDADKYRYALQDALNGTYAVYLPKTADLTDEDIEQMVHSVGWTNVKEKMEPYPEAWQVWIGRLRRFASIVRHKGA